MARINTNVAALIAQQGLATSQSQLNTALQRLSTGLQINSGEDDPAGLIVSNELQSEIAGINQGVNNSTQANNVIATAEGSLSEVSSLLLDIKGLIVSSANTGAESSSEIAANQLQVDSAVQSITRIADSTTFAGQHLIDGSLDYVTSGVNTSQIKSLNIAQADLGTTGTVPVDVKVITSARPAELVFGASQIAGSVTLQIAGASGTQTLSFTSGTEASAIAFAVNRITDSTGVSAAALNPGGSWVSGVAFQSTDYGSKNFVSITAEKGTFATTDLAGNSETRANGVDAVATVNGALTVGNGLTLDVNTSSLDLSLTLAKNFGAGATQFAITGGGAEFQLGPEVISDQQVSIGIGSVAAGSLGNNNVGFLSDIVTGGDSSLVGGNAEKASSIIEAAINQVSLLSGRLGAFQKNTLNTNIDSLNVALENVTSSNSDIEDANFAQETSNLTRAQILVQAGTSVLSTANSLPQNVLKLLQWLCGIGVGPMMAMPMEPSRFNPNAAISALLRSSGVLLIIALAGMTNLPFPFSGDQALFTLGAQALSRGAILYRDFWDLKQPGIYWFFHAAGAMFGYTEIGVHIAELIWFTMLAIIISMAMRSRFRIAWMSDVCALLTVFVYFAVCGTSHLTQLEGLVALPLFLALLMVMRSATKAQPSNRRLIAFGTLAGIIALFKLLLVAIPIGFFIVSIFPGHTKRLIRSALLTAVGLAIAFIPVAGYFGLHHQLLLVYETFFVDPAKIAAGPGMSGVSVLRGSVIWFAKAAALLLPFAAIGAFGGLKKPDRFVVAIIVWIIVATLIVLVQRLWWEYHFLLVLFPLGILASYGLEDTIGWLEKSPRRTKNIATAALLGLMLCPHAFRLIRKAGHERHFANRQAFDAFESPPYAQAVADSQWLESQYPGEIYVLGNPLIYYLSGHRQDVPLNGWSPERFLPEQWDELVQQLNASQPRYIFIDAGNYDLLAGSGEALKRLLSADFAASRVEKDGTWYERR